MMKELHLSIVSPEKSVFDGEVKIVTLPGTVGSFSILPGHAPIVSSLKAGTLGYTTMDGEELHLTPIEYKLLCLLAHNADKVLTHQFILHEIWGTATKSDLASLRVFMGTLRKKIESDPAHPRYIQTHVGIGYRLVTQP